MNRAVHKFGALLTRIIFAVCLLASLRVSGAGIEVADVDGKPHRPLELGSARAAVIVFTLHDCPISNAFSPEISRLAREFAPNGFRFFVVHTDPELSADDARKHAKEFALECPVLLDREHRLVRRLKATITPEAFVVAGDGATLYHGRIDDRFADLGKKRQEPTRRDLRLALESVANGKPIEVAATKAVGCYIPDLRAPKK